MADATCLDLTENKLGLHGHLQPKQHQQGNNFIRLRIRLQNDASPMSSYQVSHLETGFCLTQEGWSLSNSTDTSAVTITPARVCPLLTQPPPHQVSMCCVAARPHQDSLCAAAVLLRLCFASACSDACSKHHISPWGATRVCYTAPSAGVFVFFSKGKP